MGDRSRIEWTDATWNPITGCSVVSPGCTNCYAMKLAGGRLQHTPSRAGLTAPSTAGPVWNGQVRFNEPMLDQPLRWRRPRRIFVCAHGDLFHESVPDEWIDQVFVVMADCPEHTFQVLTKRPARMRSYFEARRSGDPWAEAADAIANRQGVDTHPSVLEPRDIPLPNVWLGVSAEDQPRADERIPLLLDTPAAVRFLSAEPLLGPINLERIVETDRVDGSAHWYIDARDGTVYDDVNGMIDGVYAPDVEPPCLDWVIAGGESGPGARPTHPDWFRGLRDQCQAVGVPFFFKQWGAWTPGENVERQHGMVGAASWFDDRWIFDRENLAVEDGHRDDEPDLYRVGKKAAGRMLDGRTWDEMPEAA